MRDVAFILYTVVAAAAGAAGCTSGTCVTGSSQPCGCTDGRTGAQACDSTGKYGACSCTGDAGADAATDSGVDAALGDGAMPVDGGDVDAGDDASFDSGPVDAGIDAGDVDAGADASFDSGPVDGGFDLGFDATTTAFDGGPLSDSGVTGAETVTPTAGAITALAADPTWVAWVWTDASGAHLDTVRTSGGGLQHVAAVAAPGAIAAIDVAPCLAHSPSSPFTCGADLLFWAETADVATHTFHVHATDPALGVTYGVGPALTDVTAVAMSHNGDAAFVASADTGGTSRVDEIHWMGARYASATGIVGLAGMCGDAPFLYFTTALPPVATVGEGCALYVQSVFPGGAATMVATIPCVRHAAATLGLAIPFGMTRAYYADWSTATDVGIDSVVFAGGAAMPMRHATEAGSAGTKLASDGTDVFWLRATGRIARLHPGMTPVDLPPLGSSPTLFDAAAGYFYWASGGTVLRIPLP